MKKLFASKKSLSAVTILGRAFFCIAILTLASCENFLKGANVREELSETIEIANSKPVTIVVTVDENTGTATQTSLSLKKNKVLI